MTDNDARMIDIFHSMTENQKNFIYLVIDISLKCTSKKEFQGRIQIETFDAYKSMNDDQKFFTKVLIDGGFPKEDNES